MLTANVASASRACQALQIDVNPYSAEFLKIY